MAPDLAPTCAAASWVEDVAACKPLPSDYQPRQNMSRDDSWPPCITDDGLYHRLDPNDLQTAARARSVDEIGALLWSDRRPAPADFNAARAIQDRPDGLSRFLQSQEDSHYPAGSCTPVIGVPANYPERCAGIQKLVPILNEAWSRGAAADRPLVQAARIQATLLWFLYLRTVGEALSVSAVARYADISWSNYCGAGEFESPAGLGRQVRMAGPAAHGRVWDGLLALRCWRNVDNESGAAQNSQMGNLARAQLDRALLRGLALVLRRRLADFECATADDAREGHLAFARLLVDLLNRTARVADLVTADALANALAADPPGAAELGAARTAIDKLFPCP